MSTSETDGPAEVIWEGSPTWRAHFGYTILACVLTPLVVGIVMLLLQWARLSSIRYRITTRRVEWETGILSKRIDGIDVWRVRHVEFFQSFGDRLGGVSRLHVYVQDQEDPQLIIRGLPGSRTVYDRLAGAAQLSRRGTVGLVQ